jgi:hypothetical protein
MANPVPDSKTPAMAAIAMAVLGLVIAVVQGGLTHGSLAGGILAAAGAIPATFGMWKGIQQETQGTLGVSVAAMLFALVVGGILIILRIVAYLH